MTSTRQAVLILGMHRSGTSALAGISCLLGAGAPAGMMEAAFDNPTGFWESLPITALNEAIFRSAGCGWYNSLTFNSTAIDAGSRDDLAAHCASVLTAEYGNAPSFVMKDPRFSVLLDLWLPVFAAMNVRVAPVLALRHPTEVTSSLRRRDNMPIEVAAPMWLHYSLQAERLTRGRPRALLSYDRLLRDWRGALARIAAETGLMWPVPLDSASVSIDDFLRPQMRHHHAAPSRIGVWKPPVADWIAETYSALRAIEEGGRDAPLRRLDRVHAEFASWRARAPRITMEIAAGREPLPASG